MRAASAGASHLALAAIRLRAKCLRCTAKATVAATLSLSFACTGFDVCIYGWHSRLCMGARVYRGEKGSEEGRKWLGCLQAGEERKRQVYMKIRTAEAGIRGCCWGVDVTMRCGNN